MGVSVPSRIISASKRGNPKRLLHPCKIALGPVFNPRSTTETGARHGLSPPQQTSEPSDVAVICGSLHVQGNGRFAFCAALAKAARPGMVSRCVTPGLHTLLSLSLSLVLSLRVSRFPYSFQKHFQQHDGPASAGNRTWVTSMATTYSTTKPLRPLLHLCKQT